MTRAAIRTTCEHMREATTATERAATRLEGIAGSLRQHSDGINASLESAGQGFGDVGDLLAPLPGSDRRLRRGIGPPQGFWRYPPSTSGRDVVRFQRGDGAMLGKVGDGIQERSHQITGKL